MDAALNDRGSHLFTMSTCPFYINLDKVDLISMDVYLCVCVCHREHMCTLTSSTSSCVLRVRKERVEISIGTQIVFGVIFYY